MKKINLLFVLPLLTSIVACGNPTEETPAETNIDVVLYNLLDNINVEITGSEDIIFAEPLAHLNSSNTLNINRDYSTILEDDGSKTPAIRENTNNDFTTYFRGEDGETVYEVLNADNTVAIEEYRINYNKVNFNEKFSNPFNYIDSSNIDENYNLDTVKATYIAEAFTGYTRFANSATFVIENNYAKELKFTFADRVNLIETAEGNITATSKFNLNIKFNYDVEPIKHLEPRTGADEFITSALKNSNNFTMTFNTDLLTARATVYVTEEAIYFQNDINSIGPKDGDVFYKRIAENEYESYVYKSSVEKFNLDSLSVKKSAILPDLSKIDPNILLKSSTSVYYFDKISAENVLNKFTLPYFQIDDGEGINGTLKLDENNNISYLRAMFYPSSPFTVTQNYYDYGTTQIPAWIDVNEIK